MGLPIIHQVLQVCENPSVNDSSLDTCLHQCVFLRVDCDMFMEDSDFLELGGQAPRASP